MFMDICVCVCVNWRDRMVVNESDRAREYLNEGREREREGRRKLEPLKKE